MRMYTIPEKRVRERKIEKGEFAKVSFPTFRELYMDPETNRIYWENGAPVKPCEIERAIDSVKWEWYRCDKREKEIDETERLIDMFGEIAKTMEVPTKYYVDNPYRGWYTEENIEHTLRIRFFDVHMDVDLMNDGNVWFYGYNDVNWIVYGLLSRHKLEAYLEIARRQVKSDRDDLEERRGQYKAMIEDIDSMYNFIGEHDA